MYNARHKLMYQYDLESRLSSDDAKGCVVALRILVHRRLSYSNEDTSTWCCCEKCSTFARISRSGQVSTRLAARDLEKRYPNRVLDALFINRKLSIMACLL
jgi:hypothetical protein